MGCVAIKLMMHYNIMYKAFPSVVSFDACSVKVVK